MEKEKNSVPANEVVQGDGRVAGTLGPSTAEAGQQSQPEISAATIARMMGLATATDLKLLGSKLDLVLGRVNAVAARMEKVLSAVNQMPTGSDLERIDVQLGSLKTILREALGSAAPRTREKEEAKPVPVAEETKA